MKYPSQSIITDYHVEITSKYCKAFAVVFASDWGS